MEVFLEDINYQEKYNFYIFLILIILFSEVSEIIDWNNQKINDIILDGEFSFFIAIKFHI